MPQNNQIDTNHFVREYDDSPSVEVWIDRSFVCLQLESMDKPVMVAIGDVLSLKANARERQTAYYVRPSQTY